MKAFAIDRYKGELTPREVPDPAPRPGDVVVAIAATSVNPLDTKLRERAFKAILAYKMPLILGNDLAGTVVTVGAGVRGNWIVSQVLRLASHKIRREARKRSIDYSFLFMRADGAQRTEIARLVDVGAIRPVIDHVFGFDEMPAAMERMKFGRSCGKIVIQVARDASLAAPGA